MSATLIFLPPPPPSHLVVEDGEDVLRVDGVERVDDVEVSAVDDGAVLLRLEEVAADLQHGGEHGEQAEADGVAHRVREELGNVGEVDADAGAGIVQRLEGEG